ncbi:hypothetical protein BDQ12DRAFT_698978 [Crucibulum laeve]|uniref:dihydroneopterin aldolase n=1 Tax=Crucibulum laeve TaxID=68775 RepID=A0A5C3LX29_9AGAR|nr:hypothetical protein BDQ12DRAFT_698978 [Crucibulum laeve]
MSHNLPPTTDVVFVDTLRLSANIGPDCWNKERAQPVEISVYLHLTNEYLKAAGESDNVLDSVHYGHLSKSISKLVKSRADDDSGFNGVDDLIQATTDEAFSLAKEAASEVRVIVNVPKLILLAGGFSVDVTTPSARRVDGGMKKVFIRDIVLPVLIGVNPPEREAKQRVITNIVLYESTKPHPPIDYPDLVSKLTKDMETSAYLTLEKFVMQIIHSACLYCEHIDVATVKAQKPSALSFAQSSGVEITRQRSAFI